MNFPASWKLEDKLFNYIGFPEQVQGEKNPQQKSQTSLIRK